MAKQKRNRELVLNVAESLSTSEKLLPSVEVVPVSKAVPTSRVAHKAITFYVSDERFRTLDMARRALSDRPTWSVLGNGWAEEWLASLPDELFRITR